MNTSRIHRFILVLLLGCGTKASCATPTNPPPGGVFGMAQRATSTPKKTASAEPPGLSPSLALSNSAAGRDFGIGASSLVREKIRLLADGAVGDYGLLKVTFPADLTEAPITIITVDGRTLACRATFLAVRDEATGQSLLLGQVTNSIGVLIGDNTVVYPSAFANLRADIRYRYTAYSLEQDIILHHAIKIPGTPRPANLRLEVWSEWMDSNPDTKESQTIDLRPLAAAGGLAAVAANDEQATFGAARIGNGSAFAMQDESEKSPWPKRLPESKGVTGSSSGWATPP